jgi:hypothetical protein
MRFRIIRPSRHKKNDEINKEAALVAGRKQLREKAASQIISGEVLRIGGDAVELSNIRTPSPAMSMVGGSDNGGNDNK